MLSAYDEQNEQFMKELEFEEDSENNVAEEVAFTENSDAE